MIHPELMPLLTIVAKKHNLPLRVVKSVFLIYMRFIRVGLSRLEIQHILTEEGMSELTASFTLPTIGQLYPDSRKTYAIYNNHNKNGKHRTNTIDTEDYEEDFFEESDSDIY